MSNREPILKNIINEFALLQIKIKSNNKIGLTDINIINESFVARLLNIIFDYDLECSKIINRVAVDLEDYENRVAFQVSSNKSTSKIQTTIDKFVENNLIESFDEIYFFILGSKQKTYSKLSVPKRLNFDSKQHIIDFDSLILQLKTSNLKRLKQVSSLLDEEFYKEEEAKILKSNTQVKRELKLKQNIENKLLNRLDYEDRNVSIFEPVIKFNYRDIIVRSALDFAFPEADETSTIGSLTWFKAGLYDFYENGLELQAYVGQHIIFDEKGNWDVVAYDDYKKIKKYREVTYCIYLRIPYSQIIELDMDTDPFYGLPTLRVNYNNKHEPFEEIVYGLPGSFDKKKRRVLLSNEKRTKLI